jgi:hypothetical protein
MNFWRSGGITAAVLIFLGSGFSQGQTPQQTGTAPVIGVSVSPLMPALARIPAPDDPLEMVREGAQTVQTAQERSDAVNLLIKAEKLSNVRAQAYDLKTSFTTYGSLPSDGRWILEDISPSRDVYRWTAQGPGFSGVYLYNNRMLLSNQPAGTVPLRLTQVREALFFIYPPLGPRIGMRTATVNGASGQLRCVLVARRLASLAGVTFSSGRSYEESEYCVDGMSGLLASYSPVPGLYVRYDYSSAIKFHDHLIPSGFTISENGHTVIEARTDNVSDPPDVNHSLFQTEGLSQVGVGSIMEPALMVWGNQPSTAATGTQVVVVHGTVSSDGRLGEPEILASTDSALNDEALQHVSRAHALQIDQDLQPGTTPETREAFFVVRFDPPRPCPQSSFIAGVGCARSN